MPIAPRLDVPKDLTGQAVRRFCDVRERGPAPAGVSR
jgi:hypothetical protein